MVPLRPEPHHGILERSARYFVGHLWRTKTDQGSTAESLAAERIALVCGGLQELGTIGKAFRFFRRWPVLSSTILAGMIIMAVFAPLITTGDPEKANLRHRNYPPFFQDAEADAKQVEKGREEANYFLGTDQLGRDLWRRLA